MAPRASQQHRAPPKAEPLLARQAAARPVAVTAAVANDRQKNEQVYSMEHWEAEEVATRSPAIHWEATELAASAQIEELALPEAASFVEAGAKAVEQKGPAKRAESISESLLRAFQRRQGGQEGMRAQA